MRSRLQLHVLLSGAILLFVGIMYGLFQGVTPSFAWSPTSQQAWALAHSATAIGAVIVLVVGMGLTHLRLSPRITTVMAWSWVVAAYSLAISLHLHTLAPGQGHIGTDIRVLPVLVGALNVTAAVGAISGAGLVIYGLWQREHAGVYIPDIIKPSVKFSFANEADVANSAEKPVYTLACATKEGSNMVYFATTSSAQTGVAYYHSFGFSLQTPLETKYYNIIYERDTFEFTLEETPCPNQKYISLFQTTEQLCIYYDGFGWCQVSNSPFNVAGTFRLSEKPWFFKKKILPLILILQQYSDTIAYSIYYTQAQGLRTIRMTHNHDRVREHSTNFIC